MTCQSDRNTAACLDFGIQVQLLKKSKTLRKMKEYRAFERAKIVFEEDFIAFEIVVTR